MSKKTILQSPYLLYLAWVTSLVSVLGSLYFSEILKFTPCVLCWYQRICMYPLIIILPIGIIRREKSVVLYALPLSIIGLIFALYHTLLNWNIIPEAVAPCQLGVSCTTKYINWFGFVNIPFLSFLAFAIITISMLLFWKLKITYDTGDKDHPWH